MKLFFTILILISSQISFAMSQIQGCKDNQGRLVQVRSTQDIHQAAESQIIEGQPVILANPQLMEQYPVDVQNFILAHECSHHQAGHVNSLFYDGTVPVTLEYDADCKAVKILTELKILKPGSIEQIQSFLATLVEDQTHPAGQYRAKLAGICSITFAKN